VAAKSGQFKAGEAGKRQFLRGNLENLTKERIVRKISSPGGLASVPYLCNDEASGLGASAKGTELQI